MEFRPETFGELNAADYDDLHNPETTPDTATLLADLFAGGRNILELAIGSGRIALPLAEKGFALSGIEASPDMVALVRAKPGGADIPVEIADMANFDLGRRFDHAFLVFNTLFNLTTQAAQISCFQSVANHLNPGGLFVIEAFVPDHSHYSDHQRVRMLRLDMEKVWLDAVEHDPVPQTLNMQRIRITYDGMKLVPLVMRYAYPPEIDLMARLAGMTLKHRWGGWDKAPFTRDSRFHISVYEKL